MQVQVQVFWHIKVQWTLLDMGLYIKCPTRGPVSQASLSITPRERNLTINKWKRVSWLNESRFFIHHVDGWVGMRRLQQLLYPCIPTGYGDIHWRTFSWMILGPLVLVEGTVKVVDCLGIVTDQLQPYM
ncbi:transposable element Tc1 transposase [Trichonephila clavipes]|nr:transposable element Tc1 transposase [Trichonephila clavipes]